MKIFTAEEKAKGLAIKEANKARKLAFKQQYTITLPDNSTIFPDNDGDSTGWCLVFASQDRELVYYGNPVDCLYRWSGSPEQTLLDSCYKIQDVWGSPKRKL